MAATAVRRGSSNAVLIQAAAAAGGALHRHGIKAGSPQDKVGTMMTFGLGASTT